MRPRRPSTARTSTGKAALAAGGRILLACAGLLVGLALLEGAIRLRRLFLPAGPPESIVLDDRLGWKAAPGVSFEGVRRDASGQAYPVSLHVDAFGCRTAPLPAGATARSVLFVGDSFTQAFDVSDDKAYWARIGALRGLEVHACGTGGYGTLQELLVLSDALDRMDPAAVVLQFSSNDLINNSFLLESRSYGNNNGMTRPYLLEDGRIVRRLPKSFAPLRELANRHVWSLYFILSRLDRLAARFGPSIEADIAREGPGHPLFAEASRLTNTLLARFRERAGPRRALYAFCVDEVFPFSGELRRLAAANGFTVIDGVGDAVAAAEAAGAVTRAEDGAHWNDEGHQIAGELLSHTIRD
jgi:lysophospholipase L1-like esterase